MTAPRIHTIDVQELKKRRDANPDLCLIDVRELHEWQALHIPGALHIPKDEIVTKIETHVPQRERPIYLHCKGGVRSLHAAHGLLGMGYSEVYSVDGGIDAWATCGYPVEKAK